MEFRVSGLGFKVKRFWDVRFRGLRWKVRGFGILVSIGLRVRDSRFLFGFRVVYSSYPLPGLYLP